MTSVSNDKSAQIQLVNALNEARQASADSLEKLSSGEVFTKNDPRPAERALAQNLELKLRSLSTSKRNINDAVSLVQTAESGFAEITNILTRMKEINIAAATTTLSDKERKFLFIEYEALHDEVNRIAKTTEYNNIPLLDGSNDKTPNELILRVGDPHLGSNAPNPNGDWNEIRLNELKNINATTEYLGIRSVKEYLDDDGIDVDRSDELLEPDDDQFSTVYDQAIDRISQFRAQYGAIQSRLHRAMDFNSVVEENIAAAKSKIADTDYAAEVTNLAQSQIMMQAASSLLTQTNFNSSLALNLINSVVR
jgi:flagellin